MDTSNNSIRNKIVFLILFSIAMGFLEASVVVYLRQLYYPEGFSFPLKIMALDALSIEYLREFSSIVMLFSLAIIAGRNFYERFSYFLLCFGIWDIFYYVWLKVLLNWPPSLLTWDILFLIPVIWAGPVLAPVICALTMIVIGSSMLSFQQRGYQVRMIILEWILLFLGAFITLITFLLEYSTIIIQEGYLSRITTLVTDPYFKKVIAEHIPASFNWYLFIIGEGCIISCLVLFCWRTKRSHCDV
jgi:hypothetical protein